MTDEELKPIDTSKYKITETGQVLKMTKEQTERLEEEKCELLGLIQEKDKLIEKMKCCGNCKFDTDNGWLKQLPCLNCKQCSKWELAEWKF